MPKVSFILPAYKRRFLKDAIDSILAQTCRDFELVIVDDKSPECLYEVIQEYSWEPSFETLPENGRKWNVDGVPIRYYQNEVNIGGKDLVAAWNHAMEYATGEWCVLASDDDVYMSGYLTEMLRLAEKYPQCDLFHCRVAVIDCEGEWLKVWPQWPEFQSHIQFAHAKRVRSFVTCAPDFMFRRNALIMIGGFISFPNAILSDDATWLLLAKNGVCCSPSILLQWRESGENISTRTDILLPKLTAIEDSRLWFASFAAELNPESTEDVILCREVLASADARIDAYAKHVVGSVVSLWEWYKLLRASPQRPHVKRDCIYARFPRLRAIRMLLPHFRVHKGK